MIGWLSDGQSQGECYGNNSFDRPGSATSRRAANLAVQRKLGLLPERRVGSGPVDCASSRTHRSRVEGRSSDRRLGSYAVRVAAISLVASDAWLEEWANSRYFAVLPANL